VKREQIMAQLERFNVIYAITSLVADIEKHKQILIHQLQDENRRLKAKVNQLSFCNDSERDKKVIELYKKGLPKTEIARQTALSRPGLYKALRRLGLNGLHE
jgi:flagellar biosynthesis/type III secretory pathway chaperone